MDRESVAGKSLGLIQGPENRDYVALDATIRGEVRNLVLFTGAATKGQHACGDSYRAQISLPRFIEWGRLILDLRRCANEFIHGVRSEANERR